MSVSSSSLVPNSSPLVPDEVKTSSSLVPGVWDEETRWLNNINNYQDQGRGGKQI